MRRKDREIEAVEEIVKIIDKCEVMRLAIIDGQYPYIVPLNFGYSFENGVLELYFHSAKLGRKVELLENNPHVCFEMDTSHKLTEGENACDYSYLYESVIGTGSAFMIEEIGEKVRALNALMKHLTGREFTYPDKEIDGVAVYRIIANEFSGKAKRGL